MPPKPVKTSHVILISLFLIGVIAGLAVLVRTFQQPTDADRLRGSWYAVRVITDGKEGKFAALKLVVKRNTMSMVGPAEEFRLNERTDPKQIDFASLHGIYKLEGDDLTICMSSKQSRNAKRPTRFESKEGQSVDMLDFQRCRPFPKEAPDVEFDPTLKAAILEATELAKDQKAAEFLEKFVPPDELKIMRDDGFKEVADYYKHERAPGVWNTLKLLPKIQPEFRDSEKGKLAIFDLSQMDVPETPTLLRMVFVKIADRWYILHRLEGVTAE